MSRLSSSILDDGGSVAYIDLDTTFTAYLASEMIKVEKPEALTLIRPTAENIHKVMAKVLSWEDDRYDLVILDSLTAFHHLSSKGRGLGKTARLMGSYLALFKSMSIRHNSRLIVTSLLVSRRLPEQEGGGWIPSPTGRRIMSRISDISIGISCDSSEIEIKVLNHPDAGQKDVVYKMPVS
ncbi:MAG: hypothetical protein ACE5KG_03510 [Nitrososphaerales archaeon]